MNEDTALQVSVTLEGLPASAALTADIDKHARRMLRFAPRLMACHVTVRRSEHRHRTGNRFAVHVHASLPGADIDAGSHADPEHGHEDPHVAVRDAFAALQRQLQDAVGIARAETRTPSAKLATS